MFVKLLTARYFSDEYTNVLYIRLKDIIAVEVKDNENYVVYLDDNMNFLIHKNEESERLVEWIEKHTKTMEEIVKLEEAGY